jgi:hypothetical protein
LTDVLRSLLVKASIPPSFPADDIKVLEYWRAIDAFQTAQNISREKLEKGEVKEYSFYDGPPFATGLPHYGHLLMGSIKVGAKEANNLWSRERNGCFKRCFSGTHRPHVPP